MSNEEDDIQEPFQPRAPYSEVDPNFVEFLTMDDEDDEGDEDLLTEEEEPPEEEAETATYWSTYELQGRNLSQGSAWQALAREDYNGEITVDVEGLVAGASWEFRLRLIDRNGRPSPWSDPLQMDMPTDFTPPPAPTAPDIDDSNGFITGWWDGDLVDAMPEDMSHVTFFLRQMHPDGDPDGEPGDPYKVGTLSESGSFSVGFLLTGVRYEAHLTASDTSGNESPWSDVVEFTPSSAFNTEELEEDIRKLNQETLPELESSLTSKVEKAEQDVQEFRTEWDENWDPEAIDELRGRADATDAEVATAKAEAEQAKQDAATAQANAEALEGRADATDDEVAAAKAEAEQAKQDAEAAQAKADAVESRADGLESALAEKAEASELNELDGILRGSVDLSDQVADKFYGNMAVVSRLQAEEGWIGGVALSEGAVQAEHVDMQDFTASQGFIDNAFVNLIQGKMANFDEAIIGGALLKENSVSARHFTVGDFENLFNDPLFETWGDSDMWWTNPEADEGLGVLTNQPNGPRLNYSSNAPALTSTARAEFYAHGDRGVQAAPGERFYFEYEVRASGGAEVRVVARFRDERMGTVHRAVDGPWSSGGWSNKVQFEAVAPDEHPQMLSFDIQFRNAGDGSYAQIRNLRVRRALAGKMVVEGLLQATTSELEELFFDTAVGNAISVGIANVIELNADRINSNSWSGQVLTGPVMQSHTASNTGWKIDPGDGLRMWDNSGNESVRIDGVSNHVAGSFSTNTSYGAGVTIDEGTIDWNAILTDISSVDTPYIQLRRPGSGISIESARIGLLDNGNLLIVPGGEVGGPRLWVEGSMSVGNKMTAGGPLLLMTSSGVAEMNGHYVTVAGGSSEMNGEAVLLDDGARTLGPQGLYMETSSSAQPAGIRISGPRARLRGRTPDGGSSDNMFSHMSMGSFEMVESRGYISGTITYGAPAPQGTRYPVVSPHVSSSGWSNYNWMGACTYSRSGSSFQWVIYQGYKSREGRESSYNAWLHVLAYWN